MPGGTQDEHADSPTVSARVDGDPAYPPADGGASDLVYPSTADGWEPGPPSLRAMWPSLLIGAVAPFVVYQLVRRPVGSDALALGIAGVIPAMWVLVEWRRTRHIDPIGAISLAGFALGLVVAAASGGNELVLKLRESVFTGAFGIVCLASLVGDRPPLMFFIGRMLSAGDDPERIAAYDELATIPEAKPVFVHITALWGVGLAGEAVLRTVMALALPTGTFLALSPIVAMVIFGALFAVTIRYSRFARRRAEAARLANAPLPAE